MSKDKNNPQNWRDRVGKGTSKPVNDEDKKLKGLAKGEIKPASTSTTKKANSKAVDQVLEKKKENQGEKWAEKVKPTKSISSKGIGKLKETASRTSKPTPSAKTTNKSEPKPSKKEADQTKKEVPVLSKGASKLKASSPKKTSKPAKKPPVKKPPTKGR